MNEFFNKQYMFKILGMFIVLLIIDIFFILNLWKNAFGVVGFWLNIVCIVGMFYALFLYFKPISHDEESINMEDIDEKEILNLKDTMNDILVTNDDSNLNNFLLPIKELSTNWRDKNDDEIINDLVKSNDRGIKISIDSFAVYWKMQRAKTQSENVQNNFNKQDSLKIYQLINNFIESRIVLEQSNKKPTINEDMLRDIDNAKSFIAYLIQVLDKKGDCPSVVDLHDNPNDPDSIRKNVEILNTNLYQMFTQVSLALHTYKTVEYMIDILSSRLELNVITCISSIISALGHDIGKIPDYYKNKKMSHPIVSDDMISNSDFASSFIDKNVMKMISNAILKHHSALTINNIKIDFKNNEECDLNDVVLYFLYQADLSARKYEKDIMLNTTNNMISDFDGKLKEKIEQDKLKTQANDSKIEVMALTDENIDKLSDEKEKIKNKFNAKKDF